MRTLTFADNTVVLTMTISQAQALYKALHGEEMTSVELRAIGKIKLKLANESEVEIPGVTDEEAA